MVVLTGRIYFFAIVVVSSLDIIWLITATHSPNSVINSNSSNSVDCCFAEISAVLLTFNRIDITKYLSVMYRSIGKDGKIVLPRSMTLLFLCTNHLIKDLSRLLTAKVPAFRKEKKKFALGCFGILQSAMSMSEIAEIFNNLVIVFCSQKQHPSFERSLAYLEERWRRFETDDISVKVVTDCVKDNGAEEEIDGNFVGVEIPQRYADASSFAKDLLKIAEARKEELLERLDASSADAETNEFYCRHFVKILLTAPQFLAMLPFWSAAFVMDGFPEKEQ